MTFDSLSKALDGWFDKPLAELPDALRHRVETDYSPMPWDNVSPGNRRSVAAQWDCQHDPAMENERQHWWDFYIRMDGLKKQIETWTAIATPTATDLAQKENRLAELQRDLAIMEKEKKQPYRNPADRQRNISLGQSADASNTAGKPEYIAYPKAMKSLADRLKATPEELAAWVFFGPGLELGGIAAYLNANELDPPPRFYYANYVGSFDYLAPLMGCWFIAEEIASFQPAERYITGKALIERWGKQPDIQPEAYILAKIRESRLMDCHPIYGGTEATFSGVGLFPPLETGLFPLSHIEEIEVSDFGSDKIDRSDFAKPLNAPINALSRGESLVKKPRIDAMSAEIEEVIFELGKQATPYEIMQKLKSRAQTGGCITETKPDYVLWVNESGEPSKLDMKMLRKRLERRTKKITIPR